MNLPCSKRECITNAIRNQRILIIWVWLCESVDIRIYKSSDSRHSIPLSKRKEILAKNQVSSCPTLLYFGYIQYKTFWANYRLVETGAQ